MATYAIGDIQGCYGELCDLLELLDFSPDRDQLWLLGDLVNRGPDSLGVLRFLKGLPDRSIECVLGNHDLHMLAILWGGHKRNRSDTFQDVLDAPDAGDIGEWLATHKLFHWDETLGFAMSHAGVPNAWSFADARAHSEEVMQVIRGSGRTKYFEKLYGNQPDVWDDSLAGMDRWRIITNYFTRMRLVDASARLNFSHKGALDDAPSGWAPWFSFVGDVSGTLLFGHWAALEGETGRSDILGLDTGCVWGRTLPAFCLETRQTLAVPARHA